MAASVYGQSEEAGFLEAIDAGERHGVMGVWADFLREKDDPREAGVRALLRLDRWPHETRHRGVTMWGLHDGTGLVLARDKIGVCEPSTEALRPFPSSTEMLAPPEHQLPQPWYLACWSPGNGDPDDVMFNWLTADRPGKVILMAVAAFLFLPRYLRAEYGTGEWVPVVPCPRAWYRTAHTKCRYCYLSGSLTAGQVCPTCYGDGRIHGNDVHRPLLTP